VKKTQERRKSPGAVKTLDRILSRAGVGSRTEAKRWIAERRVRVNGKVALDPERWIDPRRDRVSLDGKPLEAREKVYLLLYKPKGYLTTYRDPGGRPTVYDLLPPETPYVFPVGRLDLDTSGLLLLTNDSLLAEALTNPEHEVAKTYLVKASIRLEDEQLEALRAGVTLDDGPTRPAKVTRIREASDRTVFEITLTEGRNRQVRRMVEALGGKVLKLVRLRIGSLTIGALPIGTCRSLTAAEVLGLQRAGESKRSAPR
jgi:23S rRNA pseudouridine2605 synthase